MKQPALSAAVSFQRPATSTGGGEGGGGGAAGGGALGGSGVLDPNSPLLPLQAASAISKSDSAATLILPAP